MVPTPEQWLAATRQEVCNYDADARLYAHTEEPRFQVVDGEGLPLGTREESEREAWDSACAVCGVAAEFSDLSPEEQTIVVGHQYGGKLEPVAPPSAEYVEGGKSFLAENGELDREVRQ